MTEHFHIDDLGGISAEEREWLLAQQRERNAARSADAKRTPEIKVRKSRRGLRIGGIALASVLTLGGGTGAAIHWNFLGAKSGASAVDGMLHSEAKPGNNGVVTSPLEKLGMASLGANQCNDDKAALMVITANAQMDLVPKLDNKATAANDPTDLAPYMTEAKAKSISDKTGRALFEDFITADHFLHADTVNVPFSVKVCMAENSKAVSQAGTGKVTIERPDLTVQISAPDTWFSATQTKGDKPGDVKLNARQAQYMTLPAPQYGMFLPHGDANPGTDASLDALLKANESLQQQQIIFYSMEQDMTNELGNVVDPPKNVTFPDGAPDFQHALDIALEKRLGVDASDVTFDGNYNPVPNLAKMPKDSSHHTLAATGLDLDPKYFTLQNAAVEFGSYTQPTPTPTPTSTPTATTKPTAKSTPAAKK